MNSFIYQTFGGIFGETMVQKQQRVIAEAQRAEERKKMTEEERKRKVEERKKTMVTLSQSAS